MARKVRPVGGVLLAMTLWTTLAQADEGPEYARARAAYDRATIAYRQGDYARAASEYSLADRLVPSRQALEAALDSALLADDPVLGVELVERSARAPLAGRLATLVPKARDQFAHRTGRLRILCIPDRPCLASLDGTAIDTKKPLPLRVGPHTVALQVDGTVVQRLIDVRADDELTIAMPSPESERAPEPQPPPPPRPTQPPPESNTSGVSPGWFFAGLGLTVAVAGGTIVSALDTQSKHRRFEDEGCPQVFTSGCSDLKGDGEAAQLRTNIMIGVGAALGVTTAVTGLFFVRWRNAPAKISVGVTHSGALATLRVPL